MRPVTAQVVLLEDGTGALTISGDTTRVEATDVASARDELSDLLRGHAQRHQTVVRADLTDPTGRWTLSIDPTGAITTNPETDLADDLFGSSTAAPIAAPRRRAAIGRRGLVAGGAALALGCVTAGGWWMAQDPATLEAEPVRGWTPNIVWRSAELAAGADGTTYALPLDGVMVTAIETREGQSLVGLDMDTGTTLWATPLDEPLTGAPQPLAGRDAVAATTPHTLTIWENPEEPNAHSTTWTFTEADVEPVAGSPTPLLANPKTATALTVYEEKMLRRTIPHGTQPVAADSRGRVIATTPDGHWWVVDDEVSKPKLLEPPTFGSRVRSILGVAGQTLVVSWTGEEGASVLAGYTVDADMPLEWKADVEGAPTAADVHVSPDGSWLIAGTTAVDAATGKTQDLPSQWQTLNVGNTRAWSKDHMARRMHRASPLDQSTTDPAGVPAAISPAGAGLVVSEVDDVTRIYALEQVAAEEE